MAMATASGENVTMTSRHLQTLSLESPAGRNNRNKNRDLLMQLPSEIVTDIMKYLEPFELIALFKVSAQWKILLLESPTLWSTWNIDKRAYYWEYSAILRVLPSVEHHISNLTLDYTIDFNELIERLFNSICKGNINNLETLRLNNCYVSDRFIFDLPKIALLKLADTLKKLEIVYDQEVDLVWLASDYNNYEHKEHDTTDNQSFRSMWHASKLTFDAFKSLNTILSTCHQLEYIRYVNPHHYDSSSSSSYAIFTKKGDQALCSSLKHLEIEVASIRNVDHILKRCPNLQILRLEALTYTIRTPVLNSIQRYCPRLQYLSYNYHHDLLYGKGLYDHYYAKSSTFNNSNIATITRNSQPQSSQQSASSSLTQLNINIRDTAIAIPLINRHADTIEEMSLSIEPDYPAQLSAVRQMDRLVSLVVNHVRYPHALATLIPKFSFIRNLEFYNTRMKGNPFISTLKNVDTLEKLTIHSEISADTDEMASLFHAYAEAFMLPTINEEGEKISSDCTREPNGRRKLTHVSLIECKFLEDPILEALGNIKTLTTVSIAHAPNITTVGINSFCEQLNWLPELTSVTLSGLDCVNDSTLSILASSSTRIIAENRDVVKTIILKSLKNVTKRGLDRLSKKQGVSLTSYNCAGGH